MVFALLVVVLVVTLGFNSVYAEIGNEKIEKVTKLTKSIEALVDQLDNKDVNNKNIQKEIDQQMRQFINLTTLESGDIDRKLLRSVSIQNAIGNYSTDFFTTPSCTHVATFPDPCIGADYQSSEFSFTSPTNPLTVKVCSFGLCIENIAHEWHAPFTWTHTPIDLYFDKKYIYGIDLVNGQTTNRLLYNSPDTTNYWLNTPVNHNSLQWTINYYDAGDKSKVIWVSSTFTLGFNAN